MKQSSLEMFLDRLDPTHRADQLAFFRIMDDLGGAAREELSGRVQRVSCPPALRRLALEFVYYHPEPEWMVLLERLLRHEKDLATFETGVRTLGRMRTPASLAALRALSLSRATPGFREAVDGVLQASDPEEAFKHHLARLLQGSAQPADANEGAHRLAALLTADSLDPLKAAVDHADPLVFRHALRLVGQVPSEDAAAFLLGYLQATHLEALEDREVRVHLTTVRTLPRPEAAERCLEALGIRRPELAGALAANPLEPVAAEALRAACPGLLDGFLLETLLAAREEKPTALARHLTQAGDAAQARTRRIEFGVDAAAQGLAHLAGLGFLAAEQLLEPLTESLRQHTGRVGLVSALAQIVPAGDEERLDLLLGEPDGTLRGAALEVLGERKDPALRPAFLKVRHDPISDIAQRGLWHLGQLPDPSGTARRFLAQADREEVLTGLRFIALHRLADLLPDLLELAGGEGPEDLQVAALQTVAAVGSPESGTPVLALLHSGQSPRLQQALAETLRDLGQPVAALALGARAFELNQPSLHAVAVEAFARAHGAGARPLPPEASPVLLAAVQGAWNDRQPWPLRRRVVEALLTLHLEYPAPWGSLADLLQDTLAEKRAPGELSQEDLVRLQSCARTLAQRALA